MLQNIMNVDLKNQTYELNNLNNVEQLSHIVLFQVLEPFMRQRRPLRCLMNGLTSKQRIWTQMILFSKKKIKQQTARLCVQTH